MNEEEIFHEALARGCPEERAVYLEQACAGQPALRASVEALLRANVGASGFMDHPSPALVATLDEPIREGPGTVIGPYKLLEQIGEGGFGVVFMAEQQQPIRRKVAVKVIKPGMDSRQVIARFEAERQALALMDHPHIAKVLDAGQTASGRPYFAMELVRGVPVTAYCDQARLTPRERLDLFVTVCQAVQHAHHKGIIHRDVKPSNVLVTLHDGTPVVKVIDFGIAKAIGQPLTDKTLFTGFAQMIGTPMYLSPEQAGMSGLDVDTRSDIYSLGVLLYELLTGTVPFAEQRLRDASYDEMRRIIREEEPPKPSTRLSTLGPAATAAAAQRHSDPKRLSQLCRGELDWIVMRALEKDRNRRYETAGAFAADVQRYLHDEPVQACPPSTWYRVRKLARRYRAALATAAMLVLVLVAGAVFSTWQAIRATQAQSQERAERNAAKQAEKRANDDRDKAERAEAKAEAINQFLVKNILTFTGPGRFGYRDSDTTVAQVLEEAGQSVETAFPGQPELEASVRLTIGNTFFRIGRFKEAEHHLSKGLKLKGNLLSDSADPWGREYAETAFATKRLGLALEELGRRDEAEPLLRRGAEARRRIEIRRIPFKVNAWPFTLHPLNVLVSPDGRWLLAGGDDDLLRLYDVATGTEIHRFVGHSSSHCLAFSPDGRNALTSGHNKTVRLWDLYTAKEVRQFAGHTDVVTVVAFSPVGQHVLSASQDKTLRLWDVQSGQEIRKFLGHTDIIHHAAFSPDGRRVLSASNDGTIRLWEVATGAEIRCFQKKWAAVGSVAFSPDGQRALSKHDDGLRLWDLETGEEIRRIADATLYGGAVFTPDGRHAAGSRDARGNWCLWDLDTGKELRSYYLEPPLRPKAIEASPDGRLAVCGNFRGSISIWRMGDPPPLGQELPEARQNYERKRRDLGPDDLETLRALDELAALHVDRGEPADAEPLFRQSLESKRRILGAEHPATLAALKNMAHVVQSQKKLAEAVEHFRQCLEVYRRVQGPEHPDVIVAMNDLADSLEAQGKRDEADDLFRQCLEGWHRLLGLSHSETLAAVSKLVLKLQAHGKSVEPEHLSPAVGLVYAEMGQWDKALAGYAKAFALDLPKDPSLWLDYACLLVQLGDTDGYQELCNRLLERFGQSKNEVDVVILAHTSVLAPQALADPGPILELAQQRMAIARARHADYEWAAHVLGLAYYRAGRYEKAVECLSEFLKASPGGEHDVANWLLMAMAEQRLGHDEKAQEWFAKAARWIKEKSSDRVQQRNIPAPPGFSWRNWRMIQILHREAEAVLRGKSADQPPPKKTDKPDAKVQKP